MSRWIDMRTGHILLFVIGIVGVWVGGGGQKGSAQVLSAQTVGMVSMEAVSEAAQERAWSAVRADSGRKSSGTMGKADLELALLYYHHQEEGAEGMKALRAEGEASRAASSGQRSLQQHQWIHPVSADGERVTVEAVAAAAPSVLLQDLQRLGLEGGAVAGNLVSGQLVISALQRAAQLSSLRSLTASHARVHAGSIGSEADTSHGSAQVRMDRDISGAGQKVCALSDSYNQDTERAISAADDVRSGDLPGTGNPEGRTTPVDVLKEAETGTDEGRAMLQLIHDIAPAAALGFHTAVGGPAVFAEGMRTLATEGNCTVIVDDIGYNTEPFYQDGPVSNAVDEVVGSNDVVYVSAAGNDGQNSYTSTFRNSGEAGVLSSENERHNFDPGGVDTAQEIRVQRGGRFQIFTLQWTDPSSTVEGSVGADTDLDVALVNRSGDIVARSDRNNDSPGGSGIPVEGPFQYRNTTDQTVTLNLIIEKAAGPDPDSVKYIYSGSGYTITDDYGDTRTPTVYGHPMADGAMSVAAAPFFNTAAYNDNVSTAVLESFSSKGGVPILFDQSGARLNRPERRTKPDVTGTDGIDNTFFGNDLRTELSDPDPHPNFFGTSAAAPTVAGIAALIRQARPAMTPSAVYDRLESTALDITERQNRRGNFEAVASGVDPWSGHGFVDAEAAVPRRNVFDLQLTETTSSGAVMALEWTVREGATIQRYDLDRRYFDTAYEDLATSSAPPVTVDNPGLGVYTYRLSWTRADGKTGERMLRDTLGVRAFAVNVGENEKKRRPSVAVRWTGQPGERTADFEYQLQRKTGTDGSFEPLGPTEMGRAPPDTERVSMTRQSPGTYSYRVRAQDGAGNAVTSASKTIEIDFDGAAVAIGPYPNPTEKRATLDLTVQKAQVVAVEVYNLLGQRVYKARRRIGARAATSLTFNTTRWGSGLYLVRLRGDDFTKTRKLVVRR